MPTNWDDKWESLEWTDIEDLGGFENLLREKAEKHLAPLLSCVCVHNQQAHDRGDTCYLCKNNLKSLGYFADLGKAKHRVKIHAQSSPKHSVSAEESEQMLDETPHAIKYCFLHEDEIKEWLEEEARKKEDAKEKKKEQKKKWAEKEERQEKDRARGSRRSRSPHGGDRRSRPSSYRRSADRGRRSTDRDRRSADRDRRSADRDRRSADRDKRPFAAERDRRSSSARWPSPARDRRQRSTARDRRPSSDDDQGHPSSDVPLLNLSSSGARQQMQALILPSENFTRMSPKNILLEWLTKSESALGNARRVAEFCAKAFAVEGQKFEQASPG